MRRQLTTRPFVERSARNSECVRQPIGHRRPRTRRRGEGVHPLRFPRVACVATRTRRRCANQSLKTVGHRRRIREASSAPGRRGARHPTGVAGCADTETGLTLPTPMGVSRMQQGRPRRQPGTKRGSAVSGSTDTGSTNLVKLPPRLDAPAVSMLREQLLGRRGSDLVVDAAEVEAVSALALEVLVAAARQWSQDGRRIELRNASVAFERACRHLGLVPSTPWRAEPVELPRLTADREEECA